MMAQWLDTQLEQLVAFLDRLGALPTAALVFFGCIALGYFVRWVPWVPNSRIPGLVIGAGSVLKLLLTEWPDDANWRVWMVRQAVAGLIIGCLAWLLHDRILSAVEQWLAGKMKNFAGRLGAPQPDAAPTPQPAQHVPEERKDT